ncbi:hypothetical protein AYL99_11216 [Fonsecaea erecta]|uniref:Uncharacterized protein n=1 Tax=Fonsecaea erecta TaxID=1367422 RepID=A0A178Z4T0_9EURO|nr:hypothetical protein AYL99_11216 [Fonsecaea erecta]OAP54768.1 hypothetical protein AYL99_11216 [Fonsecaea erecta]
MFLNFHLGKNPWRKKAESLASDERKIQGKRIGEVLEKASLYTNALLSSTSESPLMDISEDVTLSSLALGSTLFRAASKICLKGLGAHYANNILDTEEFLEANEDEEEIFTWAEP